MFLGLKADFFLSDFNYFNLSRLKRRDAYEFVAHSTAFALQLQLPLLSVLLLLLAARFFFAARGNFSNCTFLGGNHTLESKTALLVIGEMRSINAVHS